MPEPCVCHIFIFILRSSDSALQRQTFFLSQNSRFNFGCIVFFVFFSHGTNFLWKTAPKQQRNTQSASWNHGTQDHYVIRAYGIPESSSHRPQMLFSLSEFRSPVFLIWSLCVALHLCSVFVWSESGAAANVSAWRRFSPSVHLVSFKYRWKNKRHCLCKTCQKKVHSNQWAEIDRPITLL